MRAEGAVDGQALSVLAVFVVSSWTSGVLVRSPLLVHSILLIRSLLVLFSPTHLPVVHKGTSLRPLAELCTQAAEERWISIRLHVTGPVSQYLTLLLAYPLLLLQRIALHAICLKRIVLAKIDRLTRHGFLLMFTLNHTGHLDFLTAPQSSLMDHSDFVDV